VSLNVFRACLVVPDFFSWTTSAGLCDLSASNALVMFETGCPRCLSAVLTACDVNSDWLSAVWSQ
jgi:hypothetical protein